MQLKICDEFKNVYGQSPVVTVRSPGRINVLGEHTDYLGGLCLPMAIDRALYISASIRNRTKAKLLKNCITVKSNLYPSEPPVNVDKECSGKFARLGALIFELVEAGFDFPAMNVLVGGDLPAGAGKPSSAAFTVGVLTAIDTLCDMKIDDSEKIRLAISSEHRAGTPCGYMDPAAVVYGKHGFVILIDCYNEEQDLIENNIGDYCWLVINSGVKRDLSDGRYAVIRMQLEKAAGALRFLDSRIEHPRFLDLAGYVSGRTAIHPEHHPFLDHYYLENERVRSFVSAISFGNVYRAGNLLFDAQASLVENLHTNIGETDWIVSELGRDEGCIGARVTGAGFGGAVIALARTDRADAIGRSVANKGSAMFSVEMTHAIVRPENGVALV